MGFFYVFNSLCFKSICRYLFIHLRLQLQLLKKSSVLLLKTFTCFKTNKVLNLDIIFPLALATVSIYTAYGLLHLCITYIPALSRVSKLYFNSLFVTTNCTFDNLLGLTSHLRIVLDLLGKDFLLPWSLILFRYILCRNVPGDNAAILHCNIISKSFANFPSLTAAVSASNDDNADSLPPLCMYVTTQPFSSTSLHSNLLIDRVLTPLQSSQ